MVKWHFNCNLETWNHFVFIYPITNSSYYLFDSIFGDNNETEKSVPMENNNRILKCLTFFFYYSIRGKIHLRGKKYI